MSSIVASPGRPSTSLHFIVGEMNGKLDQMMAAVLPQLQALREVDASLDTRVSALERGQWLVTGGGILIVFLVTSWEVIRYVIQL